MRSGEETRFSSRVLVTWNPITQFDTQSHPSLPHTLLLRSATADSSVPGYQCFAEADRHKSCVFICHRPLVLILHHLLQVSSCWKQTSLEYSCSKHCTTCRQSLTYSVTATKKCVSLSSLSGVPWENRVTLSDASDGLPNPSAVPLSSWSARCASRDMCLCFPLLLGDCLSFFKLHPCVLLSSVLLRSTSLPLSSFPVVNLSSSTRVVGHRLQFLTHPLCMFRLNDILVLFQRIYFLRLPQSRLVLPLRQDYPCLFCPEYISSFFSVTSCSVGPSSYATKRPDGAICTVYEPFCWFKTLTWTSNYCFAHHAHNNWQPHPVSPQPTTCQTHLTRPKCRPSRSHPAELFPQLVFFNGSGMKEFKAVGWTEGTGGGVVGRRAIPITQHTTTEQKSKSVQEVSKVTAFSQ